MATPAALPNALKWTCPDCHAKLDCDLPYCTSCGYGLPRFPRPAAVVFLANTLYLVVGCPAGLAAIYCLSFCLMGFWSGLLPAVVLAGVYWACAEFMLKMGVGIRPASVEQTSTHAAEHSSVRR